MKKDPGQAYVACSFGDCPAIYISVLTNARESNRYKKRERNALVALSQVIFLIVQGYLVSVHVVLFVQIISVHVVGMFQVLNDVLQGKTVAILLLFYEQKGYGDHCEDRGSQRC